MRVAAGVLAPTALTALTALTLLAGCGSGTEGSAPGQDPTSAGRGSATLASVCPQVHLVLDALVVSRPESQQRFVLELQRISTAGSGETRTALAPLLEAATVLARAGTGPDYGTAMPRIHPAVVSLDQACLRAGSPILHEGH